VVACFPGVGAETTNEGAGEGGDQAFADFVADEAACYGAWRGKGISECWGKMWMAEVDASRGTRKVHWDASCKEA